MTIKATVFRSNFLGIVLSLFVATAFSCDKGEFLQVNPELEPVSSLPDTASIYVSPADDPRSEPIDLEGNIEIIPFTDLGFLHQSTAVYGDYAFLIMNKRQAIRLYDLARKTTVSTLTKIGEQSATIYHCNQATFGTEKYEPTDSFPLLYISQRPKSDNRCFLEVFRIVPLYHAETLSLLSFRIELVQEIFFPPMSMENSLGNVNCVIDGQTGKMYTYSRNNNTKDSNYGQCKISCFSIPDIRQREVVLENTDIESSFMIDAKAGNMQGGCIVNGRLYIGQGYPAAKYVYLNVVDLRQERLVKRYDLLSRGIDWEPEGCFYYDGNVMLSYTNGISRIVENK